VRPSVFIFIVVHDLDFGQTLLLGVQDRSQQETLLSERREIAIDRTQVQIQGFSIS
jgi:hypothetical protein